MKLFFMVSLSILASAGVTLILCRFRVSHGKRIPGATMFGYPFIAVLAVLFCMSIGLEGWRVFTSDYWTGFKGGLETMLFAYACFAAIDVLPALGIATYYVWRSRRAGKHATLTH